MSGTSSKNYNCIDAAKVIMALFVVAMHTEPLINCSDPIIPVIWECIVRCAVPIFFLSSGFLLEKKAGISDAHDVILKHLRKTIKLYLAWTVIYLPLAICNFRSAGTSFIKSVIFYVRGFLLVGENYNSWMLWYLLSSIYSLLFILLLHKHRVKPLHIAIFGGILFLVGLSITEFVSLESTFPPSISLAQKLISYTITSGRIFTGFLYIPLGMLIARKEHISSLLGAILTVIGFVGNYFFDGFAGEALLAVCSTGLFIVISNIQLKDSPVYPIMRKISTVVYFIHMYVWTFYYTLVYGQKTFGWDSFFVVSILSVAIALVYIYWHSLRTVRGKPCFEGTKK